MNKIVKTVVNATTKRLHSTWICAMVEMAPASTRKFRPIRGGFGNLIEAFKHHHWPRPTVSSGREIFTVSKRNYGGKPPYTIKTVNDRVMLVLQLFDKINPDKLSLDSHFINDLGLDSLDHVEIMLQLESEFTMEIPDADAERLLTPRQIVQYICDAEDVFE